MTKKLVSFDDQAEPGQGLPAAVKAELNATYGSKATVDATVAEVSEIDETLNLGRLAPANLSPFPWAPDLDGQRVVTLGNSIENLYSYWTPQARTNGHDWPTYAHLYSSGRFWLIRNSGVGGQNTAEFLARFDTDVTPYAPTMVVIGAAENDIQQSVTLAQFQANIEAIVAKVKSIGAIPVLRTTLPHHLNEAVRTTIKTWNVWLRDYAAANRFPMLDFWTQMVNPIDGKIRPHLSNDGVHPNELGARLLGRYAVDTLWPGVSAAAMPLPGDVLGSTNRLPNPGFVDGTGNTPTSWWEQGGTPAGTTRYMTADHLVPGRMAGLRANGSTDTIGLSSETSGTSSPGDVLEFQGVFTSDGGVPVTITAAVGSTVVPVLTYAPVSGIKANMTRATYRLRFTLPEGYTNAVCQFSIGAGTGYAEFGCPIIRNLTALGLV